MLKYKRNNEGIEIFKKLMEKEIENIDRVLKLEDQILKVVEDFEGYVFNKRFENKLKEIDDNLRIDTPYQAVYIEYLIFGNNYINFKDTTYYLDRNYFSLNRYLKLEEIKNSDNRFISQKMIEKLKVGFEDLRNAKKQAFEDIEEAAEALKEYKELESKINDYNKKTSFNIQNYFNTRINL